MGGSPRGDRTASEKYVERRKLKKSSLVERYPWYRKEWQKRKNDTSGETAPLSQKYTQLERQK